MIKRSIMALALTMGLAAGASALEVSGVEIPDTLEAAGSELNLNGAGVRSKWFMDVYVGGLYLANASQDASAIISAEEPMAVKLHMVSGLVTSDKMKSATLEGFENSTGGNTAPIKDSIDQFMAVFDEEISENDVFDIVYVPGTGVEVYKNEELLNTIKGGAEFKKAVFGIWLSDKPAQDDLKAAMLGNS